VSVRQRNHVHCSTAGDPYRRVGDPPLSGRDAWLRHYGYVEDLSGVHILWVDTTHDGQPVSGFAQYEGQQGWFRAVFDEQQDEYEHPGRLILYELNDDEVAYDWRRHKAWEIKGSTKQCHHADTPSPPEASESSLAEFYAQYPPGSSDEYEDHPVIGWFWAAEG
jgi:hypothetical protein